MSSKSSKAVRAVWNDQVIAESKKALLVDGQYYFPENSVNQDFLDPSPITTRCPWKGEAMYYNLSVNGKRVMNAAWSYPKPKAKAKHLRAHIAFRAGVEIIE